MQIKIFCNISVSRRDECTSEIYLRAFAISCVRGRASSDDDDDDDDRWMEIRDARITTTGPREEILAEYLLQEAAGPVSEFT